MIIRNQKLRYIVEIELELEAEIILILNVLVHLIPLGCIFEYKISSSNINCNLQIVANDLAPSHVHISHTISQLTFDTCISCCFVYLTYIPLYIFNRLSMGFAQIRLGSVNDKSRKI